MRAKFPIVSIPLFLSLLMLCISYVKQKAEWKGAIEEENGVTVVKNPKEPMYGEDVFSIEEELSIGEKQGNEENIFSQIIDAGVDDEGNIYILDFKEAHIKVFNKSGEYVTTIGKKGQGPGEIQRPRNLVITPGCEILINDRGARFLHYFRLSGEYIRSVRQTKFLSLIRPKVDSQNNIVARIIVTGKDRVWSFILGKFDSELNKIFTVFSYEYELSPGTRNYFSPDCFWEIFNDDSIIWGYSDKYEFEILDKTGLVTQKIIKDYTPVEITKEEKQRWIKELYGETGIPPGIEVSWNRYHNAFLFMNIDDLGRIYVQTYEKTSDENGYYYDVFNPEGKYIAKIALRSRPEVWKKNKLYTIEEDEEGYQVVKRYKVMWRIE